ncbi:hypothetical protein SAY86_027152 [Trapa natans]|uniref:Uncharacterized protein n=1 Tax=Trapa natans TaxID=22666 RepID=A0AAN7KLZ2_TRANT|nr:hypothetical protein SAY86_027152 [Trapa natans]
MGKKLNSSFNVAEWAGSGRLSSVPIQVLWSSSYSDEWSNEGKRISNAISHAKFVAHSGSRWPQGDAGEEIAAGIFKLVSSLPNFVLQIEETTIPDHIQKIGDHHPHGVQGHHHGHDHVHMGEAGGYTDAYGLGHGWAT